MTFDVLNVQFQILRRLAAIDHRRNTVLRADFLAPARLVNVRGKAVNDTDSLLQILSC
jgi:hypothetical protein